VYKGGSRRAGVNISMGAALTAHPNSSDAQSRSDFTTYIQAVAVAGLVLWLYAPVLADLAVEWWTEDASSYGMLVPPIALYIVWLRRASVLAIRPFRDGRGIWLTALGCVIFLGGKLSAEFFLARISFVVLQAGLTWTFWGGARFKKLVFPFILLGTMVPLPAIVFNTLAAPLQLLASTVATQLAQFLGVSIYRDGNIIHLAGISLGVAEACSGLNSLSALVVGSLLIGFLEDASVLGRSLLFVLSVPLAIGVNVVRVTGTALLADYHMEFAMGFYHMLSGWLVFVLGFAMLWLLAKGICRINPAGEALNKC
jgi:exosortase